MGMFFIFRLWKRNRLLA